ncbi:NPCBM/NEW2 domain-containing protein [Aporhodopirellula aestuarii]|uniref:NPCBM/NEW2 domain-containing protein n=1 Tax=Aporhodopirellula aestuarii TaxID=2950107 RepID=A0ABT0U2T3_9BACT|nr:NPCBM/NEW2 domain-containing protein [Aporhodopirellula aestuarii]MCM2371210.1 NPCBM/NEW2 domain-containing protein [Aporhodopirellula aestuarii]
MLLKLLPIVLKLSLVLGCLAASVRGQSEDSRSHETITGAADTHADVDELTVAAERIAESIAEGAVASTGRVTVVYFTPSDRDPALRHVERIRRIVSEAAGFYERELRRHGFDGRRMNVLRNDRGEIDIIDVVGAGQGGDYGKPDGDKIRNEIVPVLETRGIDPARSVILLFCNLMDYDAAKGTISHHSPYYGGGSYLSGTAWQCDSEILDPLRFRDLTPLHDGEYGAITIGRHNSIFIGGVIHELGHALALPHCRQREDEAVRGTALMGAGNRTYAQELRGEGRGTFLTQAHALQLAAHPVFNRQMTKDLTKRAPADWSDLKIDATDDNQIRIRGTVQSEIPIHGVVAYFDPDGRGDYDATTATAVPDEQGRFAMRSGPLRPLNGELRLTACHVNGSKSGRSLFYRIRNDGSPDLSAIRLELELAPMINSLRRSNYDAAEASLVEIAAGDESLLRIGRQVLDRFRESDSHEMIGLGMVDAEKRSISLSKIKPTSERVGWLRPVYDAVPEKAKLLSLGGEYFAQGIYAHAPAKHVYAIQRQWNRLVGRCGVQDGHGGNVVFQIIGDDRLRWSSRVIGAGQGGRFDLDISDITTLSLVVSDSGDGNGGDWGVWIEPTLTR